MQQCDHKRTHQAVVDRSSGFDAYISHMHKSHASYGVLRGHHLQLPALLQAEQLQPLQALLGLGGLQGSEEPRPQLSRVVWDQGMCC